MRKIPFSILIVLGIASCESAGNSNPIANGTKNVTKVIDTVKQENSHRIQKKYGAQLDFCDCVKKHDSIDKVLKTSNLSNEETDKLLQRADFVEKKCKLFLTDLKSMKPADRLKHQAKVKSCLDNL